MAGTKDKKKGNIEAFKAVAGKISGGKQHLTATQLRNARKRRAKKQQKHGDGEARPNLKISVGSNHSKKSTSLTAPDPSAQYLQRPKSAPLVQVAKRFFAEHLPKGFQVYQNGPKTGWRTVSKLPVRKLDKKNKVAIGMFQPQTHTIAANSLSGSATTSYPAHHPAINLGIIALTQACQEMGIVPFDETEGTGFLRYVAMNIERATGKLQMTLIWNDNPYENLQLELLDAKSKSKKRKRNPQEKLEGQSQLERLIIHLVKHFFNSDNARKMAKDQNAAQSNLQIHSLWIHYNATWKHSNAIFDIQASEASWKHICGPTMIAEQLTDLSKALPYQPTLHFGPNVFRQANLDAFAQIVNQIRKRLQQQFPKQTSQPKLLELYGGVGTIGLHLLDLVSSYICSDENPYNRPCFQSSLTSLPNDISKKANYVPQNASDMVADSRAFLKSSQVVIVDPPRKGLEDAVLDALVQAASNESDRNIELLVYVSCGFDAFQRDFAALTRNQVWKLEHAEGHVLFPGANAIETLAFFVPSK